MDSNITIKLYRYWCRITDGRGFLPSTAKTVAAFRKWLGLNVVLTSRELGESEAMFLDEFRKQEYLHGPIGTRVPAAKERFETWGDTDVHIEHCCVEHGCKYGEWEDCTVMVNEVQAYTCEDCYWEIEN